MTFSLFSTTPTNSYPQQNTLGIQNNMGLPVNRSEIKAPIADKLEKFNEDLMIYSPSTMYGQPQSIAKVNDQEYMAFSKLTGRERVSDLPPTLKNYLHIVLRKINENKQHAISIKSCLSTTNESEIDEPMANLLKIADHIAKLMEHISVVETDITTENDFLFKKIYEIGIVFNNYKDFVGNSMHINNAVGQLGRLSFKECQTLVNHVLQDYIDFKDKIVCGIKADYEKLNEIYLQVSGMVKIVRSEEESNNEQKTASINNFIEEYSNIYNLLNSRIDQLLDKNKMVKDKFVKVLERTKANYNSPFIEYEKKLKQIKQNFKESIEFENIKKLLMNSKI